MNPEIITQIAQLINPQDVGIVVVAFMAFYTFVQIFKIKKNGGIDYKTALDNIDQKLNNHLTDVNQDIKTINKDIVGINADIKDIKQDIIKILIKR